MSNTVGSDTSGRTTYSLKYSGGPLTLRFSIYWGTRATVFDLAGGDGGDGTRVRRELLNATNYS